MIASVRSLGQNVEDLDIVEGMDTVFAAMYCFPPRVCSIYDFYQIEHETPAATKPLETGLAYNPKAKQIFGGNIQTAEQFELLAKAGFVRDLRKKPGPGTGPEPGS